MEPGTETEIPESIQITVCHWRDQRTVTSTLKPLVGLTVEKAIAELDQDGKLPGLIGPFFLNRQEISERSTQQIRIGDELKAFTLHQTPVTH
jgi:hypothetical protein